MWKVTQLSLHLAAIPSLGGPQISDQPVSLAPCTVQIQTTMLKGVCAAGG